MSDDQDHATDVRVTNPVEVEITNWAPPIKPPYVKKSTVKTYIVNPADVNAKYVQITDYEPKRLRMVIQVIDGDVALCLSQPVVSPDSSTAAKANDGLYLSGNQVYEFFGPDAFWLNALAAATRVSVLKEYC